MKHKHAELMMQYAQDAMETDKPWKRWQYNSNKDDFGFISCDKYTMAFYDDYEYRRKPKMISVTLMSGEVVSWPEPHRTELEYGDAYFYVNANGSIIIEGWECMAQEIDTLSNGWIHLTEEAAEQHAAALRKINNQVVK